MSQQTFTLIPFHSTRCVLRGGSWNKLEIYIPAGHAVAKLPTGETHFATGQKDPDGRWIMATNPDLSK